MQESTPAERAYVRWYAEKNPRGFFAALRAAAQHVRGMDPRLRELLEEELAKEDEQDWSEARSPSEWRKRLGRMSETTFRRHIKERKLVVDQITQKMIRIRRDTLRRYLGNK